MKNLLTFVFAFIFVATPAVADPITAAITALSGAFTAFGGTAIGAFIMRTAVSFGLSALANALMPKAGQQGQRGIRTSATTSGGTVPQTIVLGRYATGGNAVCPPMTHKDYLTYVIDLADYQISSLDAVFIDKERCSFVSPGNSYGTTVSGMRFSNKAWLRWYDGTQAAADDMLLSKFAGYERPWTEDHILSGVPYAVLTFKYDQEEYKSLPEVMFEILGAPLYDPRKDDTVGGVGDHRWDDASTWEFSENPAVMAYNILRGFTLEDGSIYGLGVAQKDLPIDRWIAAMNVCDSASSSHEDGAPRYKAGIEFSLEQQPLDVIADILKSCGGNVAEFGGVWNISVGPAPFPRAHFTDEDIIVSNPRDLKPFRGLANTFNGIHASYPSPETNWQAKDAPPYYRSDWEAEDGGRRLTAELNAPTVTSGYQIQRLMIEMVADNRRMISHSLTLKPSALGLVPLDTIAWTSTANGYDSKLFEIYSKTVDPLTLCVTVNLRERDASDYEYDYTQLVEPIMSPGLPVDGAPEDGDTEDDYVSAPEKPTPSVGDVVALHGGSVSRTTDGGANWTKLPGGVSGGKQISSVHGEGFVVATQSGEAHYSANLKTWKPLEFTDPAASEVVLTNGDFETGDLSGWATISGTPIILDTAQPVQRDGSVYYLTAEAGYELQQAFTTPAGVNPVDVTVSADVFVEHGAEAELRIGITASDPFDSLSHSAAGWKTVGGYSAVPNVIDNGDGSFKQARLTFVSSENADFRVDFTASSQAILWAKDVGGFRRFTFRLDVFEADGVTPAKISRAFCLRNFDVGEGARIVSHGDGFADLVANTSTQAFIEDGLSFIGPDAARSHLFVRMQASSSVEFEVVRHCDVSADKNLDFYVTDEAPSAGGLSESVIDQEKGEWHTISLGVQADPGVQIPLALIGSDAGVYFDNVKVIAGDPQADAVQCVARDLLGRRHIVATNSGVHQVKSGEVEVLGDAPISADLVAAHNDTILIAAGSDVAISNDDGSTFSQLSAPVDVAQVIAFPQALAVLTDGRIMSVSAGSIAEISAPGLPHHLAWSSRRSKWLSVSALGDVKSGTDLVSWQDDNDMPVGVTFGPRKILPLDAGRTLGYSENMRDLFYLNRNETDWKLAPSFLDQILQLQEVK